MNRRARIVGALLAGSLLASPAPVVWAQVCGDGVIDPGETCDPPNPTPDPVTGQTQCRVDCTFCGDGVVQGNNTETCDAGPQVMCGGCLSNCTERISFTLACPCALDHPSLADIRADIVASCQCDGASSRGAFVRCARDKLALIPPDRLFYGCQRSVIRCLARSMCGKPGAVTCCRTSANGKQRCSIKPDAARCTAPAGGSASLGMSESCCDACP